MPSYTLVYFDVKARGEVIRLIFAEAGQKFEDKRVSMEEWAGVKPKAPFGQLPYMEIDGKPMAQSKTIVRYLAREFNLCGDTSMQSAYCDMVLETLDDSIYKFPFMEKDEQKKKEKTQEALDKNVYPIFNKMENKFKENGGDYIINKEKMTYADLAVYHAIDLVKSFDSDIRTKYPTLASLADRVAARPNIAAYLKTRKQTPI